MIFRNLRQTRDLKGNWRAANCWSNRNRRAPQVAESAQVPLDSCGVDDHGGEFDCGRPRCNRRPRRERDPSFEGQLDTNAHMRSTAAHGCACFRCLVSCSMVAASPEHATDCTPSGIPVPPGSGAGQCGSADSFGMPAGLDSGGVSGTQRRRWVTSSSTARLFSSRRPACGASATMIAHPAALDRSVSVASLLRAEGRHYGSLSDK